MARVMLVHGSCHGSWCWRDVVPRLEASGHEVVAVDLPGRAGDARPHAEITLADHAESVMAAMGDGGPWVLVGHSAGGITLTAVAERAPERIARLVYVCAYALEDGWSLSARRKSFLRQPLLPAVRRSADGASMSVDRGMAAGIFYSSCPEEAVAYAVPRLCAEPVGPQEEVVRVTERSASVPRTYVLCERDGTIPPEGQEEMVRGWPAEDVIRLEADHSPFFSRPAELAAILNRLAG